MFPPEHWQGFCVSSIKPRTPLGNEENPTAEVEPLIYQGVKQNFSARFAGGEPDASRPSCRSALNAHPTYGVRQASHEPFIGSALERLAGLTRRKRLVLPPPYGGCPRIPVGSTHAGVNNYCHMSRCAMA